MQTMLNQEYPIDGKFVLNLRTKSGRHQMFWIRKLPLRSMLPKSGAALGIIGLVTLSAQFIVWSAENNMYLINKLQVWISLDL